MAKFDAYPMLEQSLSKLLYKTEKNWGYLQIYQKGEFYFLSLKGQSEDMLKFKSNESTHSYQLYWYKRPNPDVFVETKTLKTYKQATKSYDKIKSYQVCYKVEANPVESSINRFFAELVKDKILDEYPGNDKPVVAVVQT